MRKALIIAGLAAACAGALPAVASADTRCINPQTNGTTGALVGAVGGAAVGSALAGRHSRGEGAVLGALGGALLGGAIGHNQTRCPDGYYAYDDSTRQYYDNDGRVYQPQGYAQPGYGGGQPAYGQPAYGQPTYGQPAYGPGGPPPAYGGGGGGYWAEAGSDIRRRIDWLRQRTQRMHDEGRLNRYDSRTVFHELDSITTMEVSLRRRDGGVLSGADRDYLQSRLDHARDVLHDHREGERY